MPIMPAYLNGHVWLQRPFIALCATVAVVLVPCNAFAQPVTFRFEAEINSIREFGDPSFALPISVTPGATIEGELTLANEGNAGGVSLKLVVGDAILHSSEYKLALLDNISSQLEPFTYEGSYNGPIEVIPPEVIRSANSGIPPLYDSAFLVCDPATGSSCPPDTIPGSQNILWQPVLNLVGPDNTLSGDTVPTNVDQWNAFSGRSLLLGLVAEGQRGASFLISASLGSFSVVPEPSTIVYAGCFAAVLLLSQSRRLTGRRVI